MSRILGWVVALAVVGGSSIIWYRSSWKHGKNAIKVETAEVRVGSLEKRILARGSVAPTEESRVGAFVSGVVKALRVREGDHVKKGDLIALIDTGYSDSYVKEYEGRCEATRKLLEQRKRKLERVRELLEVGGASQEELEELEADVKSLQGDLAAQEEILARWKRDFKNAEVRAPISGTVVFVGVSKGERVTTALDATVICKIARNLDEMKAVLLVGERDLVLVQKGADARIRPLAKPESVISGKVGRISLSPRMRDGGVSFYEVEVPLRNPGWLRPEMNVRAEISAKKIDDAKIVPLKAFGFSRSDVEAVARKQQMKIEEAAGKKDGGQSLWVVRDGKITESRVEIILVSGDLAAISGDVKAGEKILTGISGVKRGDFFNFSVL